MGKKAWLGILVSMFALSAQAQEGSSTRGYLGKAENFVRGWSPEIALGAGYTGYSDELDVEGVPTSAKLLGTYVTPGRSNVFDLGFGFENQSFSQEAAPDRNVQSPVFEAAYRYQWQNGMQAGVVYDTLFNAGQSYGANQADAQFIGLQALKEFPISNEWVMRAGARYQTDLNVDGTWLNMAMLEAQFGWNAAAHRASVQAAQLEQSGHADQIRTAELADDEDDDVMDDEDLVALNPEAGATITDANEVPVAAPVPASDNSMTNAELTAAQDTLLFDSGSAELSSDEQGKLEQLAASLGDDKDAKVEVVGYADSSGPDDLNLKLSQKRAEAVKKTLVEKGVSPDQIAVVAKGEAEPAATKEQSRRVEIRKQGAKAEDSSEKSVQ